MFNKDQLGAEIVIITAVSEQTDDAILVVMMGDLFDLVFSPDTLGHEH